MLGNRYSKKPRSKDDGEKPFRISFADLMTALMTLFLVVMAVSLMVVTKKINEATQAENQRSSEIMDIYKQYILCLYRLMRIGIYIKVLMI